MLNTSKHLAASGHAIQCSASFHVCGVGCRRCLLLKFSTMKHDSVLSESRAALLTAAAAAPVNRRMAVLMSLHPRCALRL